MAATHLMPDLEQPLTDEDRAKLAALVREQIDNGAT